MFDLEKAPGIRIFSGGMRPTSPDGRVLGKMGHTERAGHDLYKNVEGDRFQPIFEGGVAYFR